jgi:hypothetical protein
MSAWLVQKLIAMLITLQVVVALQPNPTDHACN